MLGIYDPERQRVIVGGLEGGIMSGDFGSSRARNAETSASMSTGSVTVGDILATPPIISDLIQIRL
ncbi:hypothetical protein [Mesorhizobium sp. L48C026A00]|uniref:hypothetical protein n=1 Tax=Mesorhizobium sp. L48C026A00 TaxID=1287182 RepID=UPI0004175B31|nr:hypothetical protein [Mesorhizobium sp. L48C026A00]